ncbi:MAG: hypothetical protein NDJ90_09625 [Oligoflexia bacterium]|nr:hypothetical protein [Oligoflexia bacterium]
MARFEGGWFKLYRSAIESDIGDNAYCLALFIRLLSWATLKPTTIRFNGVPREIPRGSLVIGISELGEKIGCARGTVYRHLLYLESRNTIRREIATEGTLISIVNFERYQGSSDDAEREMNAEWTLDERGVNPNEEVQELKNKEIQIDQRKRRSTKVESAFNLEKAYQQYPRKQGKTKGLQRLAKEIKTEKDLGDLMTAIERYKRSSDVIRGFAKHFSTFVSEWRDWIDPQTGTIQSPGRAASSSVPLTFGEEEDGHVADVRPA